MNETTNETAQKNLHRQLAENAVEAARIAHGVKPEQLSGSTPCAEFDTRTLINHWVLFTSYGLVHRAHREQMSEELQQRDFTASADWADDYAAELDRAVEAWGDPAAWTGPVDLGGGAMTTVQVVSLNFAEMVLHGWDVAKATGQEYHWSEAAVELVLSIVEENAELYRQYKGFAEPVDVPATASAFDRALALSGRDPNWSPA